jgi:hypothetical protein
MNFDRFPSIKQKIKKTKSFYARTNKRPLVGFFLGNEYPNNRYPSYSNLPTNRYLTPDDFSIEPFLDDCEQLYAAHEACGGELLWTGTPFWGIPWLEAILGFSLIYNADSRSITAENPDKAITSKNMNTFSLNNPWVKLMKEFFVQLSAHSSGRYPLGTSRIRGLADILAVLYGSEGFVFKILDDSDDVNRALSHASSAYTKLMDFQVEHIPDFFGGAGSFYYYNWVPKGTVWHQEDSVMLLSPDLYQSVLLPFDRILYQNQKHNICHFHSTGGYIPYKEILTLNPLAVEMHLDTGGPSAQELCQSHLHIIEKTPLLIWGVFTEADMDWILSKLPSEGLALNIVVQSAEEAGEIWERINGV